MRTMSRKKIGVLDKREHKIIAEADPKELEDLKTIPPKEWDKVKKDLRGFVEGRLPEGDVWLTSRASWMTDEGWKDYQDRLSKVEYVERKRKKR